MTNDEVQTASAVVLFVDDEESILKSLRRLFLPRGIDVVTMTSGASAIEYLKGNRVDLIMSDMRMPEMTGAEFLAHAAELYPDTYRVLLTGYADVASTIAAVNEGRIHRYVAKPWVNDQLVRVIEEGVNISRLAEENKRLQHQVARQNEQLKKLNESLEERVAVRTQQISKAIKKLKRLNDNLTSSYSSTLDVLYNIININPAIDGRRAQLVSTLCRKLGDDLGLDEERVNRLALAGLLSQIGVLGLEHDIAMKGVLQMNTAERTRFYTHPKFAKLIFSPAPQFDPISTIIESQYERYSGTGVPKGLAGNAIPLESRIIALARDYCNELKISADMGESSSKEAKKLIRLGRGTVYDPELVDRVVSINISELISNDRDENSKAVAELEPGMILENDIFNLTDMLLLAAGTVLTPKSIEKLREFEKSHDQELFVKILPGSNDPAGG